MAQLQDEIAKIESGVATLGGIITQADGCGEQNIRYIIDSLQQQVATVEEIATSTRNIADKDLARLVIYVPPSYPQGSYSEPIHTLLQTRPRGSQHYNL